MEKQRSSAKEQLATIKNEHVSPAFNIMAVMMLAGVAASVVFLSQYQPSPSTPVPQITFEQKMAHLEPVLRFQIRKLDRTFRVG